MKSPRLTKWSQMKAYDMATTYAWAEYPSGDSIGVSKRESGQMLIELVNVNPTRKCPPAIALPGGYCPVATGYKPKFEIYPNGTVNAIPLENATTRAIWTGKEWAVYAKNSAPANTTSWYPTIKISSDKLGTAGAYYVFPTYNGNTLAGTFEGEMELAEVAPVLYRMKNKSTANSILYIFQLNGAMLGTTSNETVVNNVSALADNAIPAS
ncbi:hypothetical protein HK104_001583 [Borealophlyctis nickersoniae]|nr:hypothetical protein HK104_001583 [Borealophlyctis nickersoniae]